MSWRKSYSVLVVDDSENDRLLLKHVVAQFPRFEVLHELRDGLELVRYLGGEAPFADREKYPLPDLVLLDLKMPRMDGFDVLRWLKSRFLPSVKVVVLSGSTLADDVQASLALGAHGYWSKTGSVAQQRVIAAEIEALLDGLTAPEPDAGDSQAFG